ncbi:MAG: GxxExxY protein [Verrucomicrobiota bacterium]
MSVKLTEKIIGSAIEVHKELGPGLLESIYEECLTELLQDQRLTTCRQIEIPIRFRDKILSQKYRADLVVNRQVPVEIKSFSELSPILEALVLTYLKLSRLTLGLSINFNVPLLKPGIKRFTTQPTTKTNSVSSVSLW